MPFSYPPIPNEGTSICRMFSSWVPFSVEDEPVDLNEDTNDVVNSTSFGNAIIKAATDALASTLDLVSDAALNPAWGIPVIGPLIISAEIGLAAIKNLLNTMNSADGTDTLLKALWDKYVASPMIQISEVEP